MRLTFKQRFFSWFDSYDIYDDYGNVYFSVKGQLAWGHQFRIYNASGTEVGMVKQKILTLLPKFELYRGSQSLGFLKKKLTLLHPVYSLEYNDWTVTGGIMEWNYDIVDRNGRAVATISKELLHLTDTYNIDVVDENDALLVLMFVLAMDAEKCSRNNS